MLDAIRHYRTHPDPATEAANGVALLVGANGPFYPLYVWVLAPEAMPAAWLTMAASPFFLALPWLSRKHPGLARAGLPVVGLANTLWTVALFGSPSGAGAFMGPCLLLCMLLWRERAVMLAMLGLGLLAQQGALHWPWPALAGLMNQASLFNLNVTSAAALTACLALMLPRQAFRAG